VSSMVSESPIFVNFLLFQSGGKCCTKANTLSETAKMNIYYFSFASLVLGYVGLLTLNHSYVLNEIFFILFQYHIDV
jgi:hypothetical protein